MSNVAFEYYIGNYGGETIPTEKAFKRASAKAALYIEYFSCRAIDEGDLEKFPSLAACICQMAELLYKVDNNNESKELKSESTDGYSVTYVTEGADGEIANNVLERKLYAIAKIYLANTGLLYLGC